MNEVLLLSASSEESQALEPGRVLLTRLGITYRDQVISQPLRLAVMQSLLQELSNYSVAIWACGESAYMLPFIAVNAPNTLFIAVPCPTDRFSDKVLDAIFQETVQHVPVAFTPAWAAESAALLGVHWLSARHSSYQDILQAYLQQRLRPQSV